MTFLDAHMECNEGWLQPLLARIANDRSVVAVPRIDTIKDTDMSYRYNKDTGINGFHWTLIFDWYVHRTLFSIFDPARIQFSI